MASDDISDVSMESFQTASMDFLKLWMQFDFSSVSSVNQCVRVELEAERKKRSK